MSVVRLPNRMRFAKHKGDHTRLAETNRLHDGIGRCVIGLSDTLKFGIGRYVGNVTGGQEEAMEFEFGPLIDALPASAWIALADGRIEVVNRRWCEYTGFSRDRRSTKAGNAQSTSTTWRWCANDGAVSLASGQPGDATASNVSGAVDVQSGLFGEVDAHRLGAVTAA